MKKVGIITLHYYGNFGSVLQAYALQEAIREIGCDTEFVNYRNPKFGKPNPAKTAVKLLMHWAVSSRGSGFIPKPSPTSIFVRGSS